MSSFTDTEVDCGTNSDLAGSHEFPPPSSTGGSFVTALPSMANDLNDSFYLSPPSKGLHDHLHSSGMISETNPWATAEVANDGYSWLSDRLSPWMENQEALPPSMRIEGIHPGVDLTPPAAPFFDATSSTYLYTTSTNQATSKATSAPNRLEDPYDGGDEEEASDHHRDSISSTALFNKMESVERGIIHLASMLEALPNQVLAESRAPTRKLPGLPKRRSPQENALKRKVREHFVAMLGGETALLHHDRRVSISEISAFDVSLKADRANCPPCCSADALRVDLQGQPRSEWNKSAARVSALNFITSNQGNRDDLPIIEKHILTYIKTLHAKVRRLEIQLSNADEEKSKSRDRRRRRKSTLYHQRFETAMAEPLLRPHVGILQRLGPDGMSSDESDGPPGAPRIYRICILPWRAAEVTPFVRVFDAFAAIRRRSRLPHLGGGTGHGALPRVRVAAVGLFSTNDRFVPGLPVNTYMPDWISGIRNRDLTVRPTSESYNFTHDNRIFLQLGKQ